MPRARRMPPCERAGAAGCPGDAQVSDLPLCRRCGAAPGELPPRRLARRLGRPRPWLRLSAAALAGATTLAVALTAAALWTMPAAAWGPPLLPGTTVLYDAQGRPYASVNLEHPNAPVPLREIPRPLQEAVVATEDARFYRNPGFDPRGILRAAAADLAAGRAVQGGSTITEQLAKDLFLSDRKDLVRKIQQFILGIVLARRYSKARILDLYLNDVYLGQGVYGVQAASEIYFHRPVSRLDLAQCALLAGLPAAPSALDPLVNPAGARTRRAQVLERMVRRGYIDAAAATRADRASLGLDPGSFAVSYPAPYFTDYVLEQLERRVGRARVLAGGLRVYTTLSPRVQAAAEAAVARGMRGVPLAKGPQAAALAMDPADGRILAMVGGRTHPVPFALNRATQTYRQPGSAIKPLAVYTPALERGYTPMSVIADSPFRVVHGHVWPHNWNRKFHGYLTLRRALAISDNTVAVKLLQRIGIGAGYRAATRTFGLPLVNRGARNDHTLALALGGLTRGVTLLQMVDAYATFAAGGRRPRPLAVLRVTGPLGRVLWRPRPRTLARLDPRVAYLITRMLENVFRYGTGSGFALHRPTAGKTGTSSRGRDGWFVGYTPQLVAGVWEGYDDARPQPAVYGATYAGPIWRDLMRRALAGRPARAFPQPPGLVSEVVSDRSGLLPGPYTPARDRKRALFIDGTQPRRRGDRHVLVTVCANDPALLYGPGCGCVPSREVFLRPPRRLALPPGTVLLDQGRFAPRQACRPAAAGGA
ncbi:MAG: PBP1A family penicillin-binding protein [Thermaerobacter sp.]|nr:PBP1A family penicillin-binding protein [Thermaerobacter sp.]